jgi:hypothetical protein
MASMRPHWLDDVFADPSAAREALMAHKRLDEAFAEAKAAFLRTSRYQEENPGLTGSAAQSARQAFLKALDAKVDFGTED